MEPAELAGIAGLIFFAMQILRVLVVGPRLRRMRGQDRTKIRVDGRPDAP